MLKIHSTHYANLGYFLKPALSKSALQKTALGKDLLYLDNIDGYHGFWFGFISSFIVEKWLQVKYVPNTTDEFSGCGSSYFQHPKRIKLPHIYNFPSKFLVFVTQQHKHKETRRPDPRSTYPNISQYVPM